MGSLRIFRYLISQLNIALQKSADFLSFHSLQVGFVCILQTPAASSMTTDARTSSASASAVATLPLKSLNHISRNCKDLEASIEFYQHLLGFVPVKRPGSLNFAGAW